MNRRFNETLLFYINFCYVDVVVVVSESLNLRVFSKVIVSDVFSYLKKLFLNGVTHVNS